MRSWIALAVGVLALGVLVPFVQHRASADGGQAVASSSSADPAVASAVIRAPGMAVAGSTTPANDVTAGGTTADAAARGISSVGVAGSVSLGTTSRQGGAGHVSGIPPLAQLDWSHMQIGTDEAITPGPSGRVAHLALDVELQRITSKLLASIDAHEAAVVLLEQGTGRVLVWAGQGASPAPAQACADEQSPAASIFKIVTAAALVEYANLTPETRQCYSGGETRIVPSDLVDNPKRDRWCATLSDAMGRSLNVVFARLALRLLTPRKLEGMARAFAFGQSLPFDYSIAPSEAHIPEDDLGFARTAAGFWNTTLSPLHGAVIAGTIASGGELIRPILVDSVTERDNVIFRATPHQVLRRPIRTETAQALTEMMEATVMNGTSFRAFRDLEGRAFLPNITVAGKTGTLGRPKSQELVTWFVGFAPSRAPQVSISVEVVNGPQWRAKANVVAREVLRAYFAKKGAPGVTRPRTTSG